MSSFRKNLDTALHYILRKRRGTVYLSGKISPGASSTYYRGKVAQTLRDAGFHTLDPMRGKIKRGKWGDLNPAELVQRDLQDVMRSTVVLSVIMTDGRKQSFGTPCEIMFANVKNIPVVMVTDDKTLQNHPWVKHLCSRIFDNVEDAVDYIIDYYGKAEDVVPGDD
jgi:nucleoside 2-deoxyribosyltransferase